MFGDFCVIGTAFQEFTDASNFGDHRDVAAERSPDRFAVVGILGRGAVGNRGRFSPTDVDVPAAAYWSCPHAVVR